MARNKESSHETETRVPKHEHMIIESLNSERARWLSF